MRLATRVPREQSRCLSIFPFELTESPDLMDISWYGRWLDQQLKNQPQSMLDQLEHASDSLGTFIEIARLAKTDECSSIDDMVSHLLDSNTVRFRNSVDGSRALKGFVFAALGWQTMLYLPAFGTCPPQQLALADSLDGFVGQAYMVVKQDESGTKRSLQEFLLNFGLMLPRENICISQEKEDTQAFESLTMINSVQFNAFLLQSIAHIQIKWVDVLAPHLEFDRDTNTLFLFRYPSFCLANLPPSKDVAGKGVIHRCALRENDCSEHWAIESEVTQLLHEILLSYRLLFGQSTAARRLFPSIDPFAGLPPEESDSLLSLLCSQRQFDHPAFAQDRRHYRPNRDFPILRSRITSLHQQMSSMKPRGWRELWYDKRDTAQWLTFWAVIVIGGCGIILAVVQVALQAAQLAAST